MRSIPLLKLPRCYVCGSDVRVVGVLCDDPLWLALECVSCGQRFTKVVRRAGRVGRDG
ncbi:MAG: hypothetical protein QXZ56_07980 [Sulfolobales archaeon]